MGQFSKKCASCFMGLIFLIGIAGSPSAFAEETASSDNSAPEPQRVNKKLEELKKLKQDNPQEFDRLVRERKQKMKEKLMELKEKDPQKFQEVKEKLRGNRQQYLKKLREENPQKFREIMQNKMQKLNDLKQNNPEKYQRFMDKHPQLAQRLHPGGRPPSQGEEGGVENENSARRAHAGRNDS